MGFLANALVCAVAVSALSPREARGVQKRDYNAVTSDLSVLSTSISVLSTAITSYTLPDPSPSPGFNKVAIAELNVESQITKTSQDTANSAVVTADQAQSVCDYFTNSLIPIIKNTVNALVAKKSVIVQGGKQAVAQNNINALSSKAAALGASLIAKAPAAKTSCASSASSVVISVFNSAKAAYA